MESKLLSGDKNIVETANEQQLALETKRNELAEQRVRFKGFCFLGVTLPAFLFEQRKEREMLQQLETQEESTVEIQNTFSSLQQEVEMKTKKLKRMFAKLQRIKMEIRDVQEENSRRRQELESAITELTKELKLK